MRRVTPILALVPIIALVRCASLAPEAAGSVDAKTDSADPADSADAAHGTDAPDAPVTPDAAAPACTTDADCAAGLCRTATCQDGACLTEDEPYGTPCDDGDPCTTGEKCYDGACTGAPTDCADDDPCTTDGCGPETGCTNEPGPCLAVTLDPGAAGPTTVTNGAGESLTLAPGDSGHLSLPGKEGAPWVVRIPDGSHPEGQHCAPEPMRGHVGDGSAVTVRCGEHGTLDLAFGTTGVFFPGDVRGCVQDMHVFEDGRVLLVGYFADNLQDVQLVLANPDGTLGDFGDGSGKRGYPLPEKERPLAVVAQSSGRLVIGGVATDADGVQRSLLMRIHPDGSLDPTFGCPTVPGLVCTSAGAPGVALTETGAALWGKAGVQSLLVLPDDRLVWAGGGTLPGGTPAMLLAAVGPDGGAPGGGPCGGTVAPSACGLDPCSALGASCESAGASLTPLPDGGFLLGGAVEDPSGADPYVALARVDGNGSTVGAFGDGSPYVVTKVLDLHPAAITGLAVLGSGRIVASVWTGDGDAPDKGCVTAAFTPEGAPDGTFGHVAGVAVNACARFAPGIAVDSHDRVLLAPGFTDAQMAVRRLNGAGLHDQTFHGPNDGSGHVGFVEIKDQHRAAGGGGFAWDGQARAVEVTEDGRILVAGCANGEVVPYQDFALARVWP